MQRQINQPKSIPSIVIKIVYGWVFIPYAKKRKKLLCLSELKIIPTSWPVHASFICFINYFDSKSPTARKMFNFSKLHKKDKMTNLNIYIQNFEPWHSKLFIYLTMLMGHELSQELAVWGVPEADPAVTTARRQVGTTSCRTTFTGLQEDQLGHRQSKLILQGNKLTLIYTKVIKGQYNFAVVLKIHK